MDTIPFLIVLCAAMIILGSFLIYIKDVKIEEVKNKNIDNMSIREVMEYTRNLDIRDGGFSILFEKIISEIEKLQKKED